MLVTSDNCDLCRTLKGRVIVVVALIFVGELLLDLVGHVKEDLNEGLVVRLQENFGIVCYRRAVFRSLF